MAKFVWNVEEMKYRNMSDSEKRFLSDNYTLEEQQKALQEYANFNFDRFWDVYKKFQQEKNTIKVNGTHWDGSPRYNTNSLKAWLKRNGVSVPSYKSPQECMWFDIYYISSWSHSCSLKLTMDIEEINEVITYSFTHMISVLASKEESWFKAHDEYSILTKEVDHYLSNSVNLPHPNCSLWHNSNTIEIANDDNSTRKLTLDELKLLSDYYHRVEKAIEAVEKPNITF